MFCKTVAVEAKRRRLGWLALLYLVPAWVCAQTGFPCPGEQEQARATMRQVERQWPLRDGRDTVSEYVQNLGTRLAAGLPAGRSTAWRFSVVRDYAVNAFSIGGGYVYVTEGALLSARTEAELAAILAHEIGHQLAGHFCRPPPPGFWDSFLNLFRWPNGREREYSIGALTQVIDPVKEHEADQLAVRLLLSSGYDPHAMLDLARRLPPDSSHLNAPSRIRFLEQLLAGIPPGQRHDSVQFRQIQRLLGGG